VCSSWVSHYPDGFTAGRVAGLGMNESELKRNPQLTEYTCHDLNEDPLFPYDDNSFDLITNVVSVDYLNKPLLVRAALLRSVSGQIQVGYSFLARFVGVTLWSRFLGLARIMGVLAGYCAAASIFWN
jgi:hypothetical protein